MKRRLVLVLATAAAVLGVTLGASSPAAAAKHIRPTVSHYTASYTCDCYGLITMKGVHETNDHFPGVDNGPSDSYGGQDKFHGTVQFAPSTKTVFRGPADGTWCSDYNGQMSDNWEWVIEPNGHQHGWVIYPDHPSPCT